MSPERDGGVQGIVARIRGELGRRTLLAATTWAGAIVAGVLVAAWAAAGPDGWTPGTAGPLVLDLALGVAAALLLVALLARRAWLAETRIVRTVEEAAGVSPGTVLGALELSRTLPDGVSASLASHGERGVLQRIFAAGTDLSGRPGRTAHAWMRRGVGTLAVGVLVLAAVLVISPERALRSWAGLASPLELLAEPALPPLQVEPGSIELLRGSPLEVRIRAPGRSRVVLSWQAVGEVSRERTLEPLPGDSAAFAHELPAVSAPLEYRVTAPDGARSPLFRVTPVDPLFVDRVRVEITFPPHTGRAPEEYGTDAPPLRLPVGSRLRITGEASRPLASAALTPTEAREPNEGDVELRVDGHAFSGSWAPRRSGTWLWHLRDTSGGEPARRPSPLEITLVRDSVPSVTVLEPGRDTVLALSRRQPLLVEAADDYGLREMTLEARRVTSLGESEEPVLHRTPLQGTRSALARPVLDVSGWGLLPGDEVRYRVRVRDNSPAGQVAETPEYVLRMPDVAELRRDAQARLEEATRRLEAMTERATRAEEEMRELERAGEVRSGAERAAPRSPGGSGEMGFEEREELTRAVERQEQMLGELEELGDEVARMEEGLRESGAADPELSRDLAELQELLRELASPEMRERLRELRESLEARDPGRAREQMRELARDQEELRRRLEESLERFRRAATEQDVRATAEEARELARQERALADALREGDRPERRAEQQEELEERARSMEERLEELEARLERLGEADARAGVESAGERSSDARGAMEQAARSARQGRTQDAGEAADQAAEGLQEAAERLQAAQDEMARRLEEEVRRALDRTASDALALARRQEELREEMEGAGRQGIADLRGDQAAVSQGVRSLAERLMAASRGTGADTRDVAGRIGRALEATERTLEAMEGTGATPSPRASAERTVDALNGVALQALAAAERMEEGAGQGGAQELTEQLQALAQQQAGVNNQAGQLMPMELGQQAMAGQLGELSQSQGEVASRLGELSREPGAGEGALGDLEAMAREAEALARELERGRLDPGTRERQERLFHRLLDAGRSLEKDEPSREREARTAGAVERPDVTPLTSETLRMLRFALPGALRLRSLPPGQRQMVVEYFERLNREGGGRGAAPSGGGDAPPEPPPGGGP